MTLRISSVESLPGGQEFQSEFAVAIHDRQVRPSGAWLDKVYVGDEGLLSPTQLETNAAINEYETWLIDNQDVPEPEVVLQDGESKLIIDPRNKAAEYFYESATMQEWRSELVPGAVALYPIQRPFEERLPSGGVIEEEARRFFIDTRDSIGIRMRARVMSDLAKNHVSTDSSTQWVSLASGAALPVIDAVSHVRNNGGAEIRVDLVDWDASALGFAKQLVQHEHGDEHTNFYTHQSNLMKSIVATNQLVEQFGAEKANMVDALGIFEYFNNRSAARFIKHAYELVRPGGALVAANMRDTHPQFRFNQKAVGWPRLYPRSLDTLEALIKQADIPLSNVRFVQANDEVYTVMEITKEP